jgi:uncharacterized spore protein YtfJ
MSVNDVISSAQDAVTARRVFGKPYERDGVVVIPAAKVIGGGGGGEGNGDTGHGSGSGFGLAGAPVGAFVVKNGTVRWRPAFDLTAIVERALVIGALVFLLQGRRRRK